MKSHVVFGAGLIGCYLGGALKLQNLNVSLVCRPKIQEKLKSGLRLTDYQSNQGDVADLQFIPTESLRGDNVTTCDFLWLTVKCTGVAQAVEDIAPLIGADTVIFCCQNGLGSEHLVKQAFPDNLVLRVMVPFNVAEITPGHLHRGSEGHLTLESAAPRLELTELMVALIDSPLLPTTQSKEMQALLWAKLQLNLGNSINALADIPVKTMLEERGYRLVIAALMRELLQVTEALGIELPKVTALKAHWIPRVLSLPTIVFRVVANKMLAIDPNVRTSMWWDLSAGKLTEIEHLNGAILSTAERLNIACPANQKIVDLIHEVENQNQQGIPRRAKSAEELLALISEN